MLAGEKQVGLEPPNGPIKSPPSITQQQTNPRQTQLDVQTVTKTLPGPDYILGLNESFTFICSPKFVYMFPKFKLIK